VVVEGTRIVLQELQGIAKAAVAVMLAASVKAVVSVAEILALALP